MRLKCFVVVGTAIVNRVEVVNKSEHMVAKIIIDLCALVLHFGYEGKCLQDLLIEILYRCLLFGSNILNSLTQLGIKSGFRLF